MSLAPDDFLLRLEIRNTSPIDLIDLAGSFDALGRQYSEYVNEQGFGETTKARLFVHEMRSGSVIAILRDVLDQASFIYDHRDVLAGFAGDLNNIIHFFAGLPLAMPVEPTRQQADRVAQILEPVAKDGGAQLILQVTGPGSSVVVNNIYSSERARAAQEGIRRHFGPPIPTQGYFQDEVMYLHQVKGDVHARTGDRGIIERFSEKPAKLLFMNDVAKAKVLDRPYPFRAAFVVDGQVSTARGEPVQYKIFNVSDVLDRD